MRTRIGASGSGSGTVTSIIGARPGAGAGDGTVQ